MPADATLRLVGPDRREAAWNRDFFGDDPFLDFTAAADGEHTIVLHDFLHGGSPDDVYRLRVTCRPRIDFAVPACVPAASVAGAARTVPWIEVFGRPPGESLRATTGSTAGPLDSLVALRPPAELPAYRLRFAGSDSPAASTIPLFDFALPAGSHSTNAIPLGLSDVPVLVETEPNDPSVAGGRAVADTCSDATGQFFGPEDVDAYELSARKGDPLGGDHGEAHGIGGGSIVKSIERVATEGKEAETLRELDDDGERLIEGRFDTRSSTRGERGPCPRTAGTGCSSAMGREEAGSAGDPLGLFYRLLVRASRPDFDLILLPRRGGTGERDDPAAAGRGYYEVHALRRGGHALPVRAHAGFAEGVESPGAHLGPGATFAPSSSRRRRRSRRRRVDPRPRARAGRRPRFRARGPPVRVDRCAEPGTRAAPRPALVWISPGLPPLPSRRRSGADRRQAGVIRRGEGGAPREPPFDGPVQVTPLLRVSGVRRRRSPSRRRRARRWSRSRSSRALPGRYTLAFRGDA